MTFLLAEDQALKTYLSGMTVSDEKSTPRSVGVWFGFPDVEIRSQSFPFVTIDFMGMDPAYYRQSSGHLYDADYMGTTAYTVDANGNPAVWYDYEVPVAYDLTYQITSYSRHPRHDRAIIYQLNEKFPAMRGHLPVPNDLGTSTAYRHMFMERMYKSDRAEGENGNKRLLRNVYTVKVASELTPSTLPDGTPIVSQVSVNKNTAGTWTETTVPTDFTVI